MAGLNRRVLGGPQFRTVRRNPFYVQPAQVGPTPTPNTRTGYVFPSGFESPSTEPGFYVPTPNAGKPQGFSLGPPGGYEEAKTGWDKLMELANPVVDKAQSAAKSVFDWLPGGGTGTKPVDPYEDAKGATGGYTPGPPVDEAAIKGAIDSVFLDVEAQRIALIAKRDEALADGQASAAAGYDREIAQLEKNIGEMQRQIAESGSLEAWYRTAISGPLEAAKAAAEATDYTSTINLQAESQAKADDVQRESNARLDAIMQQLGFAPGASLANAEDQAILAGIGGERAATALSPAMLAAEKRLGAARQDFLLKSENARSQGRANIISNNNRRRILEAEDQIGEAKKLREEALARVARDVDRQYGSGLELPDRDSYVKEVMGRVQDSLMGDLPPGVQEAITGAAWTLINSGVTKFSKDALQKALRDGTISGIEDQEAYDDAREAYTQFPAGSAERAEAYKRMRELEEKAFDDEDMLLIGGVVDTWNRASGEYDRMIENQVEQSRTDSIGKYQNRDPKNIAAAKKGEGAYGRRAKTAAQYASTFKKMWGRRVEGQNYYRPTESYGKGRSKNSDHYTAGALDIFFNAKSKSDMDYYNKNVRPHLENLRRQGIIKSIIHPGGNAAHMDHVHISFSLDDAGHSHT